MKKLISFVKENGTTKEWLYDLGAVIVLAVIGIVVVLLVFSLYPA